MRKSDLILLLLSLLSQILQIAGQFELEMKIQNVGGEGTAFAISQDFKKLAVHSNSLNVLHIYESDSPKVGNGGMFILKQQIYLDAQAYSRIIITPSNLRIIMGAASGDLQVYTYQHQISQYQLQSNIKLFDYGSLGSIAYDPGNHNIIAVGYVGCVVIIDTESEQAKHYKVLQIISTGSGRIEAVAISHNSRYLALGGIDLQVQIYSYNSHSSLYEPCANFFENQSVKELRFVTKRQSKTSRIYLIARFDDRTLVYELQSAHQHFEKTQTILKRGYLNDLMDTFVQTSLQQVYWITVYKKSVNNTFDRRQTLYNYRSKAMYFSYITNDLLVFGTQTISSYKYCSVDFCSSCNVITHSNASTEYNCTQCITSFQVKDGKQCLSCPNYPKTCINCDKPNECSKCAKNYTMTLNHSCILCQIESCITCNENNICTHCLQDYLLNENRCRKNNFSSLIITMTIIGALFGVVIAFCLLHHKKKHISMREKLLRQSKSKKIMSRKVGNQKIKETMISTNTDNMMFSNADLNFEGEDIEEVVQ